MWNSVKQIIEKGKRLAALMLDCEPSEIGFKDGRFIVEGKLNETERSVSLFEVAARRRAAAGPARGPARTALGVLRRDRQHRGLSLRLPRLRGRDRSRGGHGRDRALRRGGRRRARRQSADHRRPDPRRHRAGRRAGALRAVLLRPGTGQLLSGSFMDYAMPRADCLPFFTTEIVEVPSPTHPLGIRPAGEGGTTPALGVVINAVVDALVRVRREARRDAGDAAAHLAGDSRGAGIGLGALPDDLSGGVRRAPRGQRRAHRRRAAGGREDAERAHARDDRSPERAPDGVGRGPGARARRSGGRGRKSVLRRRRSARAARLDTGAPRLSPGATTSAATPTPWSSFPASTGWTT